MTEATNPMKPLTNETLIEPKSVEELADKIPSSMQEVAAKVCFKEGYNRALKDVASALQAKERDMVEKFKEMIGEKKSVAELRTPMPVIFQKDIGLQVAYKEGYNEAKGEIESKLSNLSEKK